MSRPRFYAPITIEHGQPLTLPEETAHHLAKVLRLKAGDDISSFNGEGGEFHCRITHVEKSRVSVTVEAFQEKDRVPDLPVILGLCVQKRDPMDSAITRAVELGVAAITPIISEHCTVSNRIIDKRRQHWEKVIIAACEQCGMNRIPPLQSTVNIAGWIETLPAEGRLIALPGASRLERLTSKEQASVLIGPEGGFSQAELELASTEGFTGFGLGDRVLRAETAPAVALAILQHLSEGTRAGVTG